MIKKGETLQMTKLLGEGECRIRFLKKIHVPSVLLRAVPQRFTSR